MSKKNSDETELNEVEPQTGDELIINLLQDLTTDAQPDVVATEFIENFVLQEREETPRILAMIDSPSESIVEMLKHIVSQGYEAQMTALDEKGVSFVEGLKLSVKTQLTALANDTASS